MNELVSIIMPSYNTARYISDSINSVLSQTYNNWELIIIDDCSTDNTIDVVKSFKDSRIILLQNEKNSGAALSRNYALREAKGKWIAFLDSDDVWVPEKLEKQIAFMEENDYAFTFTDYRICLNGTWLPYICTGPNVVNKRKMYNYCYFSTITVIYDREVIGLIQIADLKKNNDYDEGSVSSGSKIKLIKWHYLLFKKGLKKNTITALFLTGNNLVHGVLKKLIYKKKTDQKMETRK